jgi:glyoxylase-like metal-dependent hydrolase (beta-lactamase superfamily II)
MTKTIHMLNLPFEEKWIYHPTVLYNENSNSYVLVDTGMPGQYEEILKQFEELGLPASNLSDIILTHQDIDHIGSLP